MGDSEDSCNDLCHFKGYAGCDAEKTGELVRRPRVTRVLDHLNMTCASWGADRVNFAGYSESSETCYLLKGAADCDRSQLNIHPICHCNATTSTTTLSVIWRQLVMHVASLFSLALKHVEGFCVLLSGYSFYFCLGLSRICLWHLMSMVN